MGPLAKIQARLVREQYLAVYIKFMCWGLWCYKSLFWRQSLIRVTRGKEQTFLHVPQHPANKLQEQQHYKRIYLQWLKTCFYTGSHMSNILCWILYWHITEHQGGCFVLELKKPNKITRQQIGPLCFQSHWTGSFSGNGLLPKTIIPVVTSPMSLVWSLVSAGKTLTGAAAVLRATS